MPQKIEIQKWEASMLSMSEDHFFDIIHAYFGEIETPFNKHKLLEKLSSFLSNEDVRKNIVNTLNYEDIEYLSCIYYLKNPRVADIEEIFHITFSEIRKKLLNLEERLLIYRETDNDEFYGVRYMLTPFLLDVLRPFIGNSLFLPYEKLEKPIDIEPLLTPVFFSSFYSYISENTDIFKKDGTCKKKVIDNLSAIFPALKGNEEIIELIFYCFINLKLIKKVENEIIILEEYWEKFASLSHFNKIAYLSIASIFYNTECSINPAQVFSDLLTSLKGDAWYNEKDIARALFLIYKKYFNFSETIDSEIDEVFCQAFNPSWIYGHEIIKPLVIAKRLGILIRKENSLMLNSYFKNVEEDEKPLLLSSTYEVTISQNAKLKNLLSILPGMKPIKSQTFATFQFNRQTCEKLFQKEMDDKDIIEKLQKASVHPIPQNIIASIEQWYKSYKSISLYSGFVICVDEKKRKFFENGTPLSELVKKEISEGVYLLNSSNIKEVNKQLKKAGLDFIFFNEKDYRVNLNLNFKNLENEVECLEIEEKNKLLDKLKKGEDERLAQEKKLIEKLEKENLSESIKETLLGRITRRVILNEKQLDPATIHKTGREIKAFDFLGKVKFLEEAIAKEYLLEITTNDKNVMVGYVDDIWKNIRENTVIKLDDNSSPYPKDRYIDVSQILKIKLVIQSIFS